MSRAGDPEDHAKDQMVLGPFAETKGPRLPGRDPVNKIKKHYTYYFHNPNIFRATGEPTNRFSPNS